MSTNTDHSENTDESTGTESNYLEGAAERLENDDVDEDAALVRRLRTAQEFDDAEARERSGVASRPTASITPSGRLHVAGQTDDEWLTTRWAINTEGAR